MLPELLSAAAGLEISCPCISVCLGFENSILDDFCIDYGRLVCLNGAFPRRRIQDNVPFHSVFDRCLCKGWRAGSDCNSGGDKNGFHTGPRLSPAMIPDAGRIRQSAPVISSSLHSLKLLCYLSKQQTVAPRGGHAKARVHRANRRGGVAACGPGAAVADTGDRVSVRWLIRI